MFIFSLYDSAHCLCWIWREKHSTLTSKPNSDLTEQLIRSTYVSPQLEANTVIPARLYAVSVRVEPPPNLIIAGLANCSWILSEADTVDINISFSIK